MVFLHGCRSEAQDLKALMPSEVSARIAGTGARVDVAVVPKGQAILLHQSHVFLIFLLQSHVFPILRRHGIARRELVQLPAAKFRAPHCEHLDLVNAEVSITTWSKSPTLQVMTSMRV